MLLKNNDFIQLFDKVNYVPKLASKSFSIDQLKIMPVDHIDISMLKALETKPNLYSLSKKFSNTLTFEVNGNPGMALASKLETIKAHKFYDKNKTRRRKDFFIQV